MTSPTSSSNFTSMLTPPQPPPPLLSLLQQSNQKSEAVPSKKRARSFNTISTSSKIPHPEDHKWIKVQNNLVNLATLIRIEPCFEGHVNMIRLTYLAGEKECIDYGNKLSEAKEDLKRIEHFLFSSKPNSPSHEKYLLKAQYFKGQLNEILQTKTNLEQMIKSFYSLIQSTGCREPFFEVQKSIKSLFLLYQNFKKIVPPPLYAEKHKEFLTRVHSEFDRLEIDFNLLTAQVITSVNSL